jgi:hypothetical protein
MWMGRRCYRNVEERCCRNVEGRCSRDVEERLVAERAKRLMPAAGEIRGRRSNLRALSKVQESPELELVDALSLCCISRHSCGVYEVPFRF